MTPLGIAVMIESLLQAARSQIVTTERTADGTASQLARCVTLLFQFFRKASESWGV